MNLNHLLIKKENGVLEITLHRPEIRNAFNDTLIRELIAVFEKHAQDDQVRLAVIRGSGEAFCAGGDIHWMKKSASYTTEQNQADARELGKMLSTINTFSKPVVCAVHGACFGGGLGLVSVSDVVIASSDTLFSFSEVKLGLIPAVIGPFVVAKIGESFTRNFFLTAERFPAARAFGIGLIHQVVENKEKLDGALNQIIQGMLQNSPNALKVAKHFLKNIREKSFEEKLELAACTLAELRASPEGQEGLTAFLEKRKPNWALK